MPNQGATWEMGKLGLRRLKRTLHFCPSSESTRRCDRALGNLEDGSIHDRGWDWMGFKVSSNTNQSGILGFYGGEV